MGRDKIHDKAAREDLRIAKLADAAYSANGQPLDGEFKAAPSMASKGERRGWHLHFIEAARPSDAAEDRGWLAREIAMIRNANPDELDGIDQSEPVHHDIEPTQMIGNVEPVQSMRTDLDSIEEALDNARFPASASLATAHDPDETQPMEPVEVDGRFDTTDEETP